MQVFYMSHLLYYVYMILLVLHAPIFWKCILLPGAVFLLEKGFTILAIYMGRGKTTIIEGVPLASRYMYRELELQYYYNVILLLQCIISFSTFRVTKVVIQRPPKFKFTAGDYVFVRIPEISAYEWHAFTISSAPEQVPRNCNLSCSFVSLICFFFV